MNDDPQFVAAKAAYEYAWAESRKHGDEALEALKMAEVAGPSAQLFKDRAERALLASENWRKSAEIAVEVMQEIASGMPRRPG